MIKRIQQTQQQYSQNRLRRRLLRRLLARSSIDEGDLVYDIGAGDGVITLELAARGARVVAVEKDGRLFAKLERKAGGCPRVTLRHADFFDEALPTHGPCKVFANIPFDGTARIVRKLLFNPNPPADSYLVMQREAAEKFAGIGREYLLSLLLKPWFEFSVLHRFRTDDFFPQPHAAIVLLRIERRCCRLVSPEAADAYRSFVRTALCGGKPTVKDSLKGTLSHARFCRLSKQLGFPHSASPADLTFEQWLGLFRTVSARRCLPLR